MTLSSRVVYSRSALLQHRADVTSAPSSKTRRKLWFLGILRARTPQHSEHVSQEEAGPRPTQLVPRRLDAQLPLASQPPTPLVRSCPDRCYYSLAAPSVTSARILDGNHSPVAAPIPLLGRFSISGLQDARPAAASAHHNCSRAVRRRLFHLGILRRRSEQLIPVRFSSNKQRAMSDHPPRSRLLRSLPRAPRHSRRPGRSISFGLLNVRSLHRKVDDVLSLFHDRSLDVLLLTETWHDSDSVCTNRLRSSGFIVTDRPRPRFNCDTLSTNHGGVLIMSTARVHQARLHLHSNHETFETVCVRLSSGRSSCVIILIYRTGAVTPLFFDELSTTLSQLSSYSCPLIVAGDFNIHIERPGDPHALALLDTFRAYGLTCEVNSPTHDLGGTLDLVFTRSDLPSISVSVSDPGLSDHHLLSWSIPFLLPPLVYDHITYRPWSSLNICEFKAQLVESPLCNPSLWEGLDADELAALFDSCITTVLNRLIPLRTAKLRRRPSDPWFDSLCRESKRNTRRFERRLQHLRRLASREFHHSEAIDRAQQDLKQSYLQYRSLLRERKDSFWRSKISASRHSPRDLWLSFDSLMGRGRPSPNDMMTASDFHNFFEEKVDNVREATSGSSSPTFVSASSNINFDSFLFVTSDTVARAIKQLPNKSSSRDPIHTALLKESVILVPFLTHLFNLSLSSGVFPAHWKHACITPVLKKGRLNPLEVSSYRPISNLAVLSKILEKLVSMQLRSYLRDNNLLPSFQSAYRPHYSTETAVLKLTSDILLSLDKGNVCLLSCLDLSAAFDTVDHSILLSRLHTTYGLCGTALDWFTSYLSDRSQSVRYGMSTSQSRNLGHGVPQGSVLGPLLFILFTNDLVSLVQQHGLNIHMYADDIYIYSACPPSKRHITSAQISECFDTLIAWFASNRLLLNPDKSEFMWCASRSRAKTLCFDPIRFGSLLSPPVPSIKCLGVWIDSDISFTSHISKTVATCFAVLRQIRSVRRSLTKPLRATLISALVLSRLDYCISMLSGTPAIQLHRLQAILHSSARLIFASTRFSSISPLLKELNWLPVPARIDFRLAVLASRCRQGAAPDYLMSALRPASSLPARSGLRSAATSALLVPFTRRPTLGGRSFPVTAARIWNSLPPSLRTEDNHACFKRFLSSYLLSKSST